MLQQIPLKINTLWVKLFASETKIYNFITIWLKKSPWFLQFWDFLTLCCARFFGLLIWARSTAGLVLSCSNGAQRGFYKKFRQKSTRKAAEKSIFRPEFPRLFPSGFWTRMGFWAPGIAFPEPRAQLSFSSCSSFRNPCSFKKPPLCKGRRIRPKVEDGGIVIPSR